MMSKLHHPLDRSQRLLIKEKKQVRDAKKNESKVKASKRLIKAVLQDKETQDELQTIKRVDIGSVLG